MKMQIPSIERLREVFSLEGGRLVWRIALSNTGPAGTEAGCKKDGGYRVVRLDRTLLRTHRVAFAIHHGRWPVSDIDHINGDPSDNRPENLREATRTENQCNRAAPTHNTSGHKNVSWHKKLGKWRVTVNGRHCGVFADIDEAKEAAKAARNKLQGAFARHA